MADTAKKYDFIIAGSGLAGLSIAYKMRMQKALDKKSILLIDKDSKNKNDRTWCYWSKTSETFDHINYKEWDQIYFATDHFQKSYNILPYRYKMIRGIDFYNHTLEKLKSSDNTYFLQGDIENIIENDHHVCVMASGQEYHADYILKSYYDKTDFSDDHFVWQHFKGLIIETPTNSFNPKEAYFMDFRVPQEGETRFFYVMPFSDNKALVEIAIFSENIPQSSFYDPLIEDYIQNTLGIKDYIVHEEELGAIPMTTFDFKPKQSSRVIKIGTNGGSVKASSGYAFKRIQQETDRLLNHILQNTLAEYKPRNNRFLLYDKTLLNAILSDKTTGVEVFEGLFKKISPQSIFKFLDEEGTILHDLKIFMGPPTWPFFKAFVEEVF